MTDNVKPALGHWVVNGHDFCNTDYPASLPHPYNNAEEIKLVCECTQEDYELMAKALKAAYPDGSNNAVFWTAWYPTGCSKGERSIETTVRTYVCLALFAKAMDRMRGGMGNTVEYEIVDIDNQEDINPQPMIKIYADRYAMDGVGYGVGYEKYEGTMNLVPKRVGELNSMQVKLDPLAAWLVDLDTLDVKLVDAPEEYEPECDCGEENCDCEDNLGDGGYSHPDDDFVYQEIEHIVYEAKYTPLVWVFNGVDGWQIKDYVTGKVES